MTTRAEGHGRGAFRAAACALAAGLGALSLLAAGMVVGTGAAGAQTTHAKAKAKSILACEVTDTGGLNDKSFNASAYAGLLAAVKALRRA